MITWTDGCLNHRRLIDLVPMVSHTVDHEQAWNIWGSKEFGSASIRDSWETYESWESRRLMYERHRNRHGFRLVDGAVPVENLRIRTLRW